MHRPWTSEQAARTGGRRGVSVLLTVAVALGLPAACGQDRDEDTGPTTSSGALEATGLFTPWHPKGTPSPFPDEEWFWIPRLATSPAPESLEAPAPELLDGFEQRLETAATLGPLGSERELGGLLAAAREAPQALIDQLDHPERDVRYLAARLLLRLSIEDPPCPERLAEAAARHLEDEADEVALLHLETVGRSPLPWTELVLIKCFGRFMNHRLVVARARAAAHLVRRGNFFGIPLLIRVLKEQTPLQDDVNREWSPSTRTAWWKQEALVGLEWASGQTFGFSPDAPASEQVAAIVRIEGWWERERAALWSRSPPLDDSHLLARVHELVLGLGTFQMRNVDNAQFLLTGLGPKVAPELFAALEASSFQVCRHALEILAALMPAADPTRREQWVEALTPRLGDSDGILAAKALDAIGASGLDSALQVLKEALPGELSRAEVALRRLGEFRSEKARQVLAGFAESLAEEHPLRIPTQVARLGCGDLEPLDRYLDTLAGTGSEAGRASVYLAWILDADDVSTAETPQERDAAVEEVRQRILARAAPGTDR